MTQTTSTAETAQPVSRGQRRRRKPSRAKQVIDWIEGRGALEGGLRIPDGKDAGKTVRLRAWQKREIRRIYDHNGGDVRRAILSFGRKNGKTALCAMLLLAHLVGPMAIPNTELYSSALSRDQAAILFKLAMKMVRMSALRDFVTIRETLKQLACPSLGTLYEALSADASTAMGKSPVFLVHDELGQVQGPFHRLYDALETATSAHENPLSLIISTQAPTDGDLLSILIDDALSGEDPRTVASLYAADDEVDPFSIKAIKQANPAFGDFQNRREILDMAEAARRMPAREPEYRNLILNQRVERQASFVTQSVWKSNDGDPGEGDDLYCGLDLSETNDLTALVTIWSMSGGLYGIKPTFWLPEQGLLDRSRSDRVPYNVWHEKGFLDVTPGKSVEYSYVAKKIADLILKKRVRKIGFDRYNFKHLRPWLIAAGLPEELIDATFVDFGQGFVSMSPALRALEGLLLNAKMRHGDHPVLKMCAKNARVKMDEAGNRKLDKKNSRGRIDGMTALAMAVGVADITGHEQHVFDDVDEEQILESAAA